jgi:hypothetical protein
MTNNLEPNYTCPHYIFTPDDSHFCAEHKQMLLNTSWEIRQ